MPPLEVKIVGIGVAGRPPRQLQGLLGGQVDVNSIGDSPRDMKLIRAPTRRRVPSSTALTPSLSRSIAPSLTSEPKAKLSAREAT